MFIILFSFVSQKHWLTSLDLWYWSLYMECFIFPLLLLSNIIYLFIRSVWKALFIYNQICFYLHACQLLLFPAWIEMYWLLWKCNFVWFKKIWNVYYNETNWIDRHLKYGQKEHVNGIACPRSVPFLLVEIITESYDVLKKEKKECFLHLTGLIRYWHDDIVKI